LIGDGSGDSPALKKADVGFSMGNAGTQSSHEASSVMVLDDSLCSVVEGIKWGRNLFQCMRNIVQFYLTTVLVTFIMTFVGAVFLKESPLNPLQVLWICFLAHFFILALSAEAAEARCRASLTQGSC
jgi:P-type E1-E2 ATPase